MTRRINLVPISERTRTTTDTGLLVMIVVAIVVLFGLGFGYFVMDNRLTNREQELADVQQQVALIETQVAALRQYELVQTQRAEVESVVAGIYAARTPVSDILDDLSLVVPDGVWFDNLSLTVADPTIETKTNSDGGDTKVTLAAGARAFEDVAQLLIRLRLVPSLTGVELISASGGADGDTGQDVKSFTVTGSVVDTSPEDELPMSQIDMEAP